MDTDNTYIELNAQLDQFDSEGNLQLHKDREAVRAYFLEFINRKTMFFHSLEEKLDYMVRENYYEPEFLAKYSDEFVKEKFKQAYAYKFRFPNLIGAHKFYSSYAQKTFDGETFLERYEDRIVVTALYLADGDEELATTAIDEYMSGRLVAATPTLLNAGKKSRGELVSCFLLKMPDNLEAISRSLNSFMQLSKRGGGVAVLLTDIRAKGSPIKNVQGQSSGIVPIMKQFSVAASFVDQLGARKGSIATYLHACHQDIMDFLDTKRENSAEGVRISDISLGIVMPDVAYKAARENKDLYLFNPYDIFRVYGKPMSEISIDDEYDSLINNPEISKEKVNARHLFAQIALVQRESGYPYLLHEGFANKEHANKGRINMSNLCSEIIEYNSDSFYNEDLSYSEIGRDISCNLASQPVGRLLDSPNFGESVITAIRLLTQVSTMSSIESVPSVKNGNSLSHSVGLGSMGIAGFLGASKIHYDSSEAIEFTSAYFMLVNYWTLVASNQLASENESVYYGFEDSTYASGEYFDRYLENDYTPKTDTVRSIFESRGIKFPSVQDWAELKKSVSETGLFNAYRMAVAPNGSIGYISGSTPSLHPVTAKLEARKEGKIGRLFLAAPGMDETNVEYFKDAYEVGWKALIDLHAAAAIHVDQSISCTVFLKDSVSTAEMNKMHAYAAKRVKSLYYVRLKSDNVAGTDLDCVSCAI